MTLSSSVFYTKKKSAFAGKLNLIALMDIFTILVFFLLLSSGDSRNIEDAKFVSLPDSSTGTAPHEDLKILIGEDEIWLNEVVIAKVDDVLKNPKKHLQPLGEALEANTEKKSKLSGFEEKNGLAVTILGDKTTSYSLLKSVMAKCRLHDYRNVSLAVNRVVRSVYDPFGLETRSNGANAEAAAESVGEVQ